jgi:AcrR family transcriptional regulator
MLAAMVRAAAPSERAEETRRRIVDAATGLFAEHGYHATSLNDVIQAAGSTKGGFYFHFGSKSELALAVIQGTRERFRREVFAAMELHSSAVDQLVSMVRAVAAVMATGAHARPKVGDLGRLCQELREEVEVPRDAIDPYAGWIVIVEELLARARSEGAFDDTEIDLRWGAQFLVGAYVGVEELLRDDGFTDRIDDHLRLTFRALGLHSAMLDPS